MVFEPGQRNARPRRAGEEPGVPENRFLHPVLVDLAHGRLFVIGLIQPPAFVVAHAVVKLKRVDLEEIEIDEQRHLLAQVAGPSRAELGLDAVEQPAPVPVIVAFAEDGASVSVTLVLPELTVDVPDAPESTGPFLSGTL